MSRQASVFLLSLLLMIPRPAFSQERSAPLLLRTPTLSRTQIVFSFGGDLWSVPRSGGEARRLTAGAGIKTTPMFSPDGTHIAYTGDVNGNQDVYVISAMGGEPRRLTFHPGPDQVVGWTPDGRRVAFCSTRNAYANPIVPKFPQLFTVAVEGGLETKAPLPMVNEACFSPDGSRLAYVPLERKNFYFRRYRGGRTTPIWIARLSDSHIEAIPRHNSTDFNPMWIGQTIYFLSDRNGPATLFAYRVKTRQVRQVLVNHGLDLSSASAGPGAIIYEQFGSLHLYDLTSGKTQEVKVQIHADFPELRPHIIHVGNALHSARLSPSGEYAVFEARGEILTLDATSGKARNVTESPGVMERDPAWSPDGKTLAYFSDESGEYALHLQQADRIGAVEKIGLGEPPCFYYSPRWSPDGTQIAYTDRRLDVWTVDRRTRTPVKVDTHVPLSSLSPAWSPDSQWLAYAKLLKNGFRAIFLYSLRTGQRTRITDLLHDAASPVFSPDGSRLYFTADTDATRPETRNVYVITLQETAPATLSTTRGDERTSQNGTQTRIRSDAGDLRMDLGHIEQRIKAVPVPAKKYIGLVAAEDEVLFLLESTSASIFDPPNLNVFRLDLKTGRNEPFLTGVSSISFTDNGRKALFQNGDQWVVCATTTPPKPDEGRLMTAALEVRVEPLAAWRQMYREVWRLVRDFFYDPGLHGLDSDAMRALYAPYVEGLVRRADLNALFTEMLANLSVSHVAIHGGDIPNATPVSVGLLGADYALENGRYRFAHIYAADPWNPGMKAPLTGPNAKGNAKVKVGEYLLAVNGQTLSGHDNLYRLFEGTTGKPTTLRVGPAPNGAGAREITVTPIANELSLRFWAWVESNRRRVAEATQGRVAYVYIAHTLDFDGVNYDLAAQKDKGALILDARFNLGGDLPGAFVQKLAQTLQLYRVDRQGMDSPYPQGFYGPKVLLINEYAGSGGDALALFFRKMGVGPILGKRTWGGLTGAFDTPELMDGGMVEIPDVAFRDADGGWAAENRGVAPDQEVELDPEQVRKGYDPQLEQAIATALRLLNKRPGLLPKRPIYPDHSR